MVRRWGWMWMVGCTTVPDPARLSSEIEVAPLAALDPPRGCDATTEMAAVIEALSDVPLDEGVWSTRIWPPSGEGVVRDWLAVAHCDRRSDTTVWFSLPGLTLAGGGFALAEDRHRSGDLPGAVQAIAEVWTVSQNVARDGSLTSVMVDGVVERTAVDHLISLAPELSPYQIAALGRRVTWLVKRRPEVSAVADSRALDGVVAPTWWEWPALARCRAVGRSNAPRIDAAYRAGDADALSRIEADLRASGRFDPGARCASGVARVMQQAMASRRDNDAAVRRLVQILDTLSGEPVPNGP